MPSDQEKQDAREAERGHNEQWFHSRQLETCTEKYTCKCCRELTSLILAQRAEAVEAARPEIENNAIDLIVAAAQGLLQNEHLESLEDRWGLPSAILERDKRIEREARIKALQWVAKQDIVDESFDLSDEEGECICKLCAEIARLRAEGCNR